MIIFLLIICLAMCGAPGVHGIANITEVANPGEFNYFVMVWYGNEFRCGGTIIDQRHIITRATCVMGIPSSRLSIIAGRVSTHKSDVRPLQVERVHIHYGFKAIHNWEVFGRIHWVHDIAVLKLVNRMIWNSHTGPAALATGEYNHDVELECIVPGWNQVYPGRIMERYYIRWIRGEGYSYDHCVRSGVFLVKNEKCAFWKVKPPVNTIHYWSGSPIVHGNAVIGIVDGQQRDSFYAFLDLFPYKDFIANVIDDSKYDVSPGEMGYIVSVWDRGSFKCGGIILDASYILTTGYCVQYANQTNLKVIAGHTQILKDDPRIQWLSIERIEIHSGYEEIIHVDGPKSMQIKNNYALLKLAAPLTWGPTIGSAPLPSRYSDFTDRFCRTFRWHNAYTVDGKELLQLVWFEVYIMHPEVCRNAGVDLEADEICVSSQYAQHPKNLDSNGNPVVCEGFVIGVIPNFSTVPQFSCLTSVLSIWPFIDAVNNVC